MELYWDLPDGRTIVATREFALEHYPGCVLNQQDRSFHYTKVELDAFRKAAYQQEADPLFFMSQRGEATTEEWQAKIAEIKARYPYPAE
jgi:hypothetical protein